VARFARLLPLVGALACNPARTGAGDAGAPIDAAAGCGALGRACTSDGDCCGGLICNLVCLPTTFALASPRAGVVLPQVTLVSVVAANDPTPEPLLAYGDQMQASDWWRTVSSAYDIGPIAHHYKVTGPALNNRDMTTNDLRKYALALAPQVPALDGTFIFLLYLPPTAGFTSPAAYGYHAVLGAGTDSFAVVQRPGNVSDVMRQIMEVASHEVFETATDPTSEGYFVAPQTATPWMENIWLSYTGPAGNELADMCAGMDVREGEAWYQRVWSNRAILQRSDPCVPAGEPVFFDVTPAAAWYPLAAGAQVTIPAVAWATGAIARWPTHTQIDYQSTSDGFGVQIVEAASDGRVMLAGGDTIHLVVSAPPSAPSGAYVVVGIVSLDPASPDFIVGRTWPVGVYVP
jgi:hypothetical protein